MEVADKMELILIDVVDGQAVPHLFGNVMTWPVKELEALRQEARQKLKSHGHTKTDARDPVVRENCAACVLEKIQEEIKAGTYDPNAEGGYAGAVRVLVQGSVRVPVALLLRELKSGGDYAENLKRDLVTFSALNRGTIIR